MDLFTGRWTLNHAASSFTIPAPLEWTQVIEVWADGLRSYERVVGANGGVSEHAVDGRFDGAEYPVHGSPAVDTIAYTRPGPGQIDGVARKAGAVVFRETVTVTSDGGTMTTALSIPRPDGTSLDSVAVFDRLGDESTS